MKNRTDLLQTQSAKQLLVMSPQMQKALHLLQLPVLELTSFIEAEMEQNPLLEYAEEPFSINEDCRTAHSLQKEDTDLKNFLENTIAYEHSLFDHLMRQAQERFSSPQDLFLAKMIIGNLDDHGFLSTPLEEIALFSNTTPAELEPLLQQIQTFDPMGIGAKNLQESFLIQLKLQGKENSLAYKIVDQHFDEMLKNKLPLIGKALSVSTKTIFSIIEKEIATLNLHPGATISHSHYQEVVHYITPDAIIDIRDGELVAEINDDKIPSLRFNAKYLELLADKNIPKETKEYIKEKLASGTWFLKNISERNHTLTMILQEVVKKQRKFFVTPKGKLLPFMMKDVAFKLSLHESTIVRAVANKYVSTPRGVFPLRFFFTHGYLSDHGEGISSFTIKEQVREIIEQEDRNSPFSDEMITTILKEKGFSCARRTVAKYRSELGIGNTTERKCHFISD